MAIYDDLANIIKGNRGDRLDMMIPLGIAALSTLADARWGWIGAPSVTVFLAVFGLIYAIWRVIAICVKKISGEWYRDQFSKLLDLEASSDRREEIRQMREELLANMESERRIVSILRKLRVEDTIWQKGRARAGDRASLYGKSPTREYLERLGLRRSQQREEAADTHGPSQV